MKLLLRGGRVFDPAYSLDRAADVLIVDGRIERVEPGIAPPADTRVLDCRDRLVVPGFVDVHVHLREPGYVHKEDIASGTRAAAAGGYTTVCCMANTLPVNDSREVTEAIVRGAQERGVVRVMPVGAITRGLQGKELADLCGMRAAGAVAFSDDGRSVMDAALMRRALEQARLMGVPVSQHCEDENLARGGVVHEGAVAARLGLRGQPSCAETVILARDLELVEMTGARYHAAHLSTVGSCRLVREAKRRGLRVTAEVTPHHLVLTEEAVLGGDTNTRVNPPLRSTADREALREALADGTIDCIATDHAPHAAQEKGDDLATAAPGLVGLETALGLCLGLVREKVLSLERLIAAMTVAPARAFGLSAGTLAPGSVADVAVVDLHRVWKVTPSAFCSKSRNTPFAGWELVGKVVLTVCGGRIVHEEE